MRELFLQTLQKPNSVENSRNIIRVLNSLFVDDFRQIMTTAAEKEIVRKALFEPRQIDLIYAMRNRIVRLGSPDLPGLFSEFERENQSQETNRVVQQSAHGVLSMRVSYDIAIKKSNIQHFVTEDRRKAIRFVDSEYSDIPPRKEDVVELFVGHCNTDVPVSLYLDFLRSYLEQAGHSSARNMFALPSFSKDGGTRPFFYLCVDKADVAAIFALMDRLYVVVEGGREVAKKLAAGDQLLVHFILAATSTTVEAVSQEWPSNMVLLFPNFESKRAQPIDDAAAALPVYPPHHHPMPNVQRLAPPAAPVFINQPSPLPYFGVNPFRQNGNAELSVRVGMFSGPVYPANHPNHRPPVQCSANESVRLQGRVGMFSHPNHVQTISRADLPGREIIPENAEVPLPSFMAPQQNPPAAPAVPLPSDPLVAVMRGMKPV